MPDSDDMNRILLVGQNESVMAREEFLRELANMASGSSRHFLVVSGHISPTPREIAWQLRVRFE